MRASLVLAAACLAACAAPPDSTWARIQRDRLERLHAPRLPDAAVAQAVQQAPRAASQDPRHLDQREPASPGTGPRPFRGPLLSVQATAGVGDVAVRVAGTQLDDRTPAHFFAAGLDTGTGAGLRMNVISSDAGLFEGRRINDGIAPADADASRFGFDVFPHLRTATGTGALRVPVRFGVFADWQQLEHERAGVHRQWLAIGPRLLLEPTWRLAGNASRALDLFGEVGGDCGPAWFDESFHGGGDRDTTFRVSGDLGIGLRALFGTVHAEAGYRLQHTLYGATEGDLWGDRSRTEFQSQQLFLGFGLTY